MAAVNLGFVSCIATFSANFSRSRREKAMRPFETHTENGGAALTDEIAARFASLCDFALKRVLREHHSSLKTLRVESGYGYAEHHKDWLRLGCELMAEEDEADQAYSFLADPMNAGVLDSRIENATDEFVQRQLSSSLFDEISCTFHLLENPEKAS